MRFELPDDVGAALEARASEQGLSLEKWFQKLAEQLPAKPVYSPFKPIDRSDTPAPLSGRDREWPGASEGEHHSVVEGMRELRARVKPDPEGWTTRDYINYGRR